MSRVDLKLGFSCNNDCRFCVQGQEKRARYPDRGTAEVRALLEEARRHADELVLTGGEVTIRPDLPEVVAHARKLGFRVIQLQTNGRVLGSPRALARLVEAGITEVSPAVHGPTAEIHDALTRRPGSFRQTVQGIRNARAHGLPVLVNSVITRANHQLLPALADLLVALGVQQFQLAFVHPLGTAAERYEEVVPRLSAVAPHARQAVARGFARGVRAMTEAIPLCFMRGWERFAAEAIIPPTRIVDAAWTVADYTRLRVEEGKAKGPPCAACARRDVCEGPWREYPAHFGWEEFQPVSA